MTEFLLAHQTPIRLAAFCAVLAAMMVWEVRAPRRTLSAGRLERWTSNLGLVALNTAALRLAFPMAAVGVAAIAADRGWGLFNAVAAPAWAAVLLSVVALDLAIYVQHVVFHKVPILWRLHRMHHTDVDIDTTTGIRFHPIEIGLSMAIKAAAIVALGAPPAAVIVFEVLLNATAMFNHGNVRLSPGIDRVLRRVVVTPDFHRVHHSVHRDETDSNYGFNLSVWDYAFGTYRAQPRDGHLGMTIGLDIFRDPRRRRIDQLLIQPFVSDRGR
jgi:sterol desaturase/sphingolipid hydroxylase (fatty acid hydroxylase superfamily)